MRKTAGGRGGEGESVMAAEAGECVEGGGRRKGEVSEEKEGVTGRGVSDRIQKCASMGLTQRQERG